LPKIEIEILYLDRPSVKGEKKEKKEKEIKKIISDLKGNKKKI
jgi:hypothetical protein